MKQNSQLLDNVESHEMADVTAKDGYNWDSPSPADSPPAAPTTVSVQGNARRRHHSDEEEDVGYGRKAGYGWDESPETSRHTEGHLESGTRA
jgi:hypothetical protein